MVVCWELVVFEASFTLNCQLTPFSTSKKSQARPHQLDASTWSFDPVPLSGRWVVRWVCPSLYVRMKCQSIMAFYGKHYDSVISKIGNELLCGAIWGPWNGDNIVLSQWPTPCIGDVVWCGVNHHTICFQIYWIIINTLRLSIMSSKIKRTEMTTKRQWMKIIFKICQRVISVVIYVVDIWRPQSASWCPWQKPVRKFMISKIICFLITFSDLTEKVLV